MKGAPRCPLARGFSLPEKLYAQTSFIAMGVLGSVGILLEDPIWIAPYILIYWYGIPGIVMRHLNCPRCPHLHEFGDCLQFPPSLTMALVRRRKVHPFGKLEKGTFYAIFLLIPAYPIFWLLSNGPLLVGFLSMAALWYAGQLLYFCRRCRVFSCPFNRAAASYRVSAA